MERALSWVTRVVGAAALAYAVVLAVATLTETPEPFGDEAWLGSGVWSILHGHGLSPSIAAGSGIYDGTIDYWLPRIGMLPQLLAGAIGGTSLGVYRGASLVVVLIACALLVRALTARYGLGPATAAVAAVATSWIVFEASHYVRWDGVTFLWATVLAVVLLRGPPGVRAAVVAGAMLGVAPDFSAPLVALVPAAALYVAWEPDGRRRRLAWFCGGVAFGFVAYLLLHYLPDPHEARTQWGIVYSNEYKVPLLAAIEQHSLHPIFAERDRYHALGLAPFARSRWTLYAAIAAAVATLAVRLRRGAYPVRTVGAALLLSQLIGLALLYGNRAAMYFVGAMPFAAVALVEGLSLLPRRFAAPVATIVPAILALIGGLAIIDAARHAPRGAAADPALAAAVERVLPAHGTAMGDFVYWWAVRDARFRFNADIWARRHDDHVPFRRAFEELCPTVVLYDDFWEGRYSYFGPGSLGRRFPALAPTDPHEEGKLLAILEREYRQPALVVAGGRAVEVWRRRAPCVTAPNER